MDAEMKTPTAEKVVEKKVYEDGCKKQEYASKGLAGTALGLGIGGLALSLLNGGLAGLGGWGAAPAMGSRTLFGGVTPSNMSLPENVNINMGGAWLGGPSPLTVLEKENADKFSLYKGYRDAYDELSNRMNSEMFSLYKSQIDADFRLYASQIKGDFGNYQAMMQGDAALKDAMVQQGFNLYKNNRDLYDAVDAKYAARFAELDKKVAVMEAVRPYQDKILMGDMARYYERGINYVDRKTCRCIYGDVVLPSTPTITGFQSANPWGCNCGVRTAAAASEPATPTA